jgi:hypothetical protein
VVRRRPAEPYHHRPRGEHHLYRDIPQTLSRGSRPQFTPIGAVSRLVRHPGSSAQSGAP